jgi:hypothetical protein
MAHQTGRQHHMPIGVLVERALIGLAILGIVLVVAVNFL